MTPTDPIEAEATGQQYVTATYAGRPWRIHLDVDNWPLGAILDCIAVKDQRLVVNKVGILFALQLLLGEQWPEFLAAAPKTRHLVPASQTFAAAVGLSANPNEPLDIAFGAIPRLILDLRHHHSEIEATLAQLGFDYRHRFLFEAGRRRLTLRQIHVHLTHAPRTSPYKVAKLGPAPDAALAVMDLYEAWTGKAHPSRPLNTEQRSQRATAGDKAAQAKADYKARHRKPRESAADLARSNARTLQGKA